MKDINKQIVDLRMASMHPSDIYKKLGCTLRHVNNVINTQTERGALFPPLAPLDDCGQRSIKIRFQFDEQGSVEFQKAAKARGTTVEKLVFRLMTVIAKEPVLIGNILDDGK